MAVREVTHSDCQGVNIMFVGEVTELLSGRSYSECQGGQWLSVRSQWLSWRSYSNCQGGHSGCQ